MSTVGRQGGGVCWGSRARRCRVGGGRKAGAVPAGGWARIPAPGTRAVIGSPACTAVPA